MESPNGVEPKRGLQLRIVLFANELIEICLSNAADPVGNSEVMLERGQVFSPSTLPALFYI